MPAGINEAITVIQEPPEQVVVHERPSPDRVIIQGTARPGAPGATGATGPQGPQGVPGGSSFFHFVQGIPSSVWNIPHLLGYKPNIQAFDNTGRQIFGDLDHIDDNNARYSFSYAFSGEAECS